MPQHKITLPARKQADVCLHEHQSLDEGWVVVLLFRDRTAYTTGDHPTLHTGLVDLGYHVDHIDQVPADYIAAAAAAKVHDRRVLVPGTATP